MTVLRDVEVLEHWLQIQSLVQNCIPVLNEDLLHGLVVIGETFQVLSAGHHGVFRGEGFH